MLKLTSKEKDEIKIYKKIYYFNNKINDHIIYRFQILKLLGKGSFSTVNKVYDYKNNTTIAIKMITNTNTITNTIPNEVTILSNLKKKEQNYITKLYEFFIFRNTKYIVFKLYDITLHELIYYKPNKPNKPNKSILEQNRIRYISQILHAIEYLKDNKIIHRDIKPNNIVLKDNTYKDIILIDFGCAISNINCNINCNKECIQTIAYRSPEIVLNNLYNKKLHYNYKIDIWSVGCIIYELFLYKRLFDSKTNGDLFINYNIILNAPPTNMIKQIPEIHTFYDDIKSPSCIKYKNTIYTFNKTKFKNIFINKFGETAIIDLILKCCEWDIENRINCKQAIELLAINIKDK